MKIIKRILGLLKEAEFNHYNRSVEMGNITSSGTGWKKVMPNNLGIDSIKSVGDDLFDIIEKIVNVLEDGKVSIWEYPGLAGSITGNGITIVQHITDAIKESSDLTKAERLEIRTYLTKRGTEIFKFGDKQGEYGTEGIQNGIRELSNLVVIIKNAASNGIGFEDIAIIPAIASSVVGLVEGIGDMAKEFADIHISEGAILIGFMINELLDILDGVGIVFPANK